jgi:transaldolase
MKFFLDTANIDEIREVAETGLLDGVTTNPSLVAKEKRKFEDVVADICQIVKGPTSAEVISLEYKGMIEEAEKLAKISDHVVIKVPLTEEGLKACKHLSDNNIRVNVTLCFSTNQALLAAKAGATYISPFIGRLDDIGKDGMAMIDEISQLYATHRFETKILAASIRHTEHLRQSALAGADVATMPYKVFKQLYKHPLTDIGIERFLADWKKAQA